MIASWSMVMVHGLMVAGLKFANLSEIMGSRMAEPRGAFWVSVSNVVQFRPVGWPVPQPKRLKRKFISQLTGLGPFQCPAYAPSSAENGQVGRS